MESRERNGGNNKKKLKNQAFSFRMNMRKIRTVVWIETERILVAAQKGKSENWFRMTMRKFHTIMRNAPRRQIWVLVHFPLRTIVRNCWSSCKITFFPDFFGEKASVRPLRWCQVSTWLWPINRNLIYSFEDFFTFF